MNQSAANRFDPWNAQGVLLIMLLYCAVHLLLRVSLSSTIGVDEAIEGVFTQKLAIGYDQRQPPLYTWLLWLVQAVTGPSLFGYLLLKYALLITTFILYLRVANRLFGEPRLAGIATFSLLLLYQIGWNGHEGVTHTQVLMLTCTWSFLAFLDVAARGRWIDYALFGLAVGAGFLSKFSYGAFLAALVIAALIHRPYRSSLLTPRLVLTVLAALLVTAPYLLWLFTDGQNLATVFQHTFGGGGTPPAERIGKGLLKSSLAVLGFLSPLLPILLLLFPRTLRAVGGNPAPVDADLERLIRTMLLVSLGLLVLGIVAAGATRYKERWLHPFLILAPLYFFARVRRTDPSDNRLRLFATIVVAVSVFVIALRIATLVIGPPLCNRCRPLVPYADLADALVVAGFRDGTIVVKNGNTAGNLRAAFPRARIYVLNNPNYHPPPPAFGSHRQCLVVWPLKTTPPQFPKGAERYLDLPPGAAQRFEPTIVRVAWSRLQPPKNDRFSSWAYVLFDGPRGRCR